MIIYFRTNQWIWDGCNEISMQQKESKCGIAALHDTAEGTDMPSNKKVLQIHSKKCFSQFCFTTAKQPVSSVVSITDQVGYNDWPFLLTCRDQHLIVVHKQIIFYYKASHPVIKVYDIWPLAQHSRTAAVIDAHLCWFFQMIP